MKFRGTSSIPSLFKAKWMLTCGCVAVCLSLSFAMYLSYRSELNWIITFLKSIERNLVHAQLNGDGLEIQNLVSELDSNAGVSSYSLKMGSDQIVQFPIGGPESECKLFSFTYPVERYGLVMGRFRGCLSLSGIVQRAVSSPLFLSSWLVFLFLVFLWAKLRSQEKLHELARQVAHDIRSPVSTLQVVLERSEAWDPKDKKLLHSSIKRIEEIAASLLTAPNKQTHPAASCSVPLKTVLWEFFDAKRLEHRNRTDVDFQLKFELPEDLKLIIPSGSLLRILSNLLNNAVEAMPGGGDIVMTARLDEPERLSIEIDDEGIGVPPDDLNRVFAQGYSTKKSGNGLGLSGARKALKEFGGSIVLGSKRGVGTRVVLTLPIAAAELVSAPSTVLIDNDPLVRLTWRASAERRKKNLLTYSSGKEFLSDIDRVSRNSLIYVDSELGEEVGEDIAKDIFNHGFREIRLATGNRIQREKYPWIKAVVDKCPPW